MDTLSHGLWGALYAKAINKKIKEPIKARWAFWWGVAPDIVAFVPIFIYEFYLRVFGKGGMLHPPTGEIEPWTPGLGTMSDFTQLAYSFTHSAVIFLLVVILYYAFYKKIPWVLGGWLIHIVLDIFSHSYAFYATPILFPISGWRFDGLAWGMHWWMSAINYGVLLVIFLFLKYRKQSSSL